jgi:hypothetical protein
MSGVLDRLRDELDQLGDKVSGALEKGKLHLERTNVMGFRNDAARELGMLAWKKSLGEDVDEARYEKLIDKMNDYKAKLDTIDREIAAAKAEDVSVGTDPPPESEPVTAEVEVVPETEEAAGEGSPTA